MQPLGSTPGVGRHHRPGPSEFGRLTEGVPLTLSARIRDTLSELEKIKSQPGIEARYSGGHAYLSVFRFDHGMIITPLLTHRVGHDAPTLHLHRYQDDGMFDRFASRVEELWSNGTPVWGGNSSG
ncbi:hypothetical protein [Streptomyces gobiensis]|uniref:hypothetical protein n=1 Tax=Streptomyces gobiensis TaxID=2875706 RepID=UPI001E63D940|nr:hypothetical protein [Streptomyces gobiensis]UGY91338.1 hypothetical protein test1122_06135 [Streptomyces gobiensis]